MLAAVFPTLTAARADVALAPTSAPPGAAESPGAERRLAKVRPISYFAAMAIRPILIHPEPRLRKVADPVAGVDASVRALADDMLATMYDAPGLGLAAPQVGVLKLSLIHI